MATSFRQLDQVPTIVQLQRACVLAPPLLTYE
jgi:hypothetical protein